MLTIFEFVKESLTPRQVAKYYMGEPTLKGFYHSPFRREKTASFKVSDKRGFHDFGSNEHYDIIGFVGKLFNCSPLLACEVLIRDFNLNYSVDDNDLKKIQKLKKIRQLERIREQEKKEWYENQYEYFSDRFKEWAKLERELDYLVYKKRMGDLVDSLNIAIIQRLKFEYLTDVFYSFGGNKKGIDLLYENKGEIDNYGGFREFKA